MTLFKEELQEHLAATPFDTNVRASYPGMAHFARTGPQGSTCRECSNWKHDKWDYHSKSGKHHGLIKPASCRKYREIIGVEGARVPDDAQACKYFDLNREVPARFAK